MFGEPAPFHPEWDTNLKLACSRNACSLLNRGWGRSVADGKNNDQMNMPATKVLVPEPLNDRVLIRKRYPSGRGNQMLQCLASGLCPLY